MDDESPLNKAIELPSMRIVVRAGFYENNKYYPQVFIDQCLCNLWIIQKCYVLIELTFLKEVMLIRQRNQENVIFVTIGNTFVQQMPLFLNDVYEP